ncbi:MAG: hypothetical protein R3C56_38575 [Pirellulaceae bacterium]
MMADKNNILADRASPPTDAKVHTTACDYCVVGCGYKVYTWPLGTSGGTQADENALAMDFPTYEFSGQWISPNAHSQCVVDGQEHHVAVIADSDLSSRQQGWKPFGSWRLFGQESLRL